MNTNKVPFMMMRMGNHDYCKKFRAGAYTDTKVIEDYKVEYAIQEGSQSILIWSPKEPCVHIVLYDNDTIASLIWVGYDAKCNTEGNMERGTGTRKMLDFAFRLAKQHGATHIELMDDAKVDCNGKKIDLSPMYFLKHGMTWYESKFGFQPRDEYKEEYAMMKEARKNLDISFLQKQPCDYFTRSMVRDILRNLDGDRDVFYRTSWIKTL